MAVETIALKEIAKIVIEKGLEIAKKGLETSIEKLKEGKGLSESFNDGLNSMKEASFDELKNFISPEKVEALEANQEKITELQDQIEDNPESVLDDPQNFVKELVTSENTITELVNEINTIEFPSEFKNVLYEILDTIKQIQEIKDELKNLGLDFDKIFKELLMSSSTNEGVDNIDDLGDQESE